MSQKPAFRYEVQYKFSGSCDLVDVWLAENCLGDFTITTKNLPTRLESNGNVIIAFENEADRSLFRDQVLKGLEACGA